MPCPYCQHDQIVYVHGHGQCAKCGINIEPCCDGGQCEMPTHDAQERPRAASGEPVVAEGR